MTLPLFDLPAPLRPTRRRSNTPATRPLANTTAVATHSPGRWTIQFPAPAQMLSSNSRLHWRVTSPIRKTWREAMYVHAIAAKLPKGLARIRVDVELRFPTARKADAPNYHHYLCKPIVDAIGPAREQVVRRGRRSGTVVREVGYGMVPDDTEEYVDGPHPTIGDPVRDKAKPYGEVVVTITDLTGQAVAS